MFNKISIRLALMFTAFVVLLLLLNGAIFLSADIRSLRQGNDGRLLHEGQRILTGIETTPPDQWPAVIGSRSRDRARIVDPQGHVLYTSDLLNLAPFIPTQSEFLDMDIQGEEYRLLTIPIVQRGVGLGYLQLADHTMMDITDLQGRIDRFLFASALISILTFFIGLFLAKRSLRPAEESMQRLERSSVPRPADGSWGSSCSAAFVP